VITGDYRGAGRWQSEALKPGTPLQPPPPLFTKLDPGLADEELARLEKP
jgi:methionyl-tRNA synthetase